MKIKSAKQIMEEVEMTRKQIGTVTMVLDGAQVHYMIESYVESLNVVAALFQLSKNTDPEDWSNIEFGSQEESLRGARELGLTAISVLKTFMEALPDNLKAFDKQITPGKLNIIEEFFKDK